MSEKIHPPEEVTAKVFQKWRNARRGKTIAEDLTNPYWSWLVQSEESSWAANRHFGGPSSIDAGAAWSFNRFGQSTTTLSDGRILLIAGEHEDHYDPDFFIYNDITVRHPDGRIEILGFSENVFPPTDFHSASLVNGKIILIGNLGYPEHRKSGETQVLVIDPTTWEIKTQLTTGEEPGWIYEHQATVEEGAITVQRGKVWTNRDDSFSGNFDDWRLHLADWRWERLTNRPITIYKFKRKDGKPNQLFDMQMWSFQQEMGELKLPDMPELEGLDIRTEIQNNMKGVAPKDPKAYASRYQPDGVDYKILPDHEESLEQHLEVQGILVRYTEDPDDVHLVIEGELPPEIIQKLHDDLKSKLELTSGEAYVARQIQP